MRSRMSCHSQFSYSGGPTIKSNWRREVSLFVWMQGKGIHVVPFCRGSLHLLQISNDFVISFLYVCLRKWFEYCLSFSALRWDSVFFSHSIKCERDKGTKETSIIFGLYASSGLLLHCSSFFFSILLSVQRISIYDYDAIVVAFSNEYFAFSVASDLRI